MKFSENIKKGLLTIFWSAVKEAVLFLISELSKENETPKIEK